MHLLLKSILQKRKFGDPLTDVGNNLFPELSVFYRPNGSFLGKASNKLVLIYPTHWCFPTAPSPFDLSFNHQLLQARSISSCDKAKEP